MQNLNLNHGSYFITGIDTDIGKTYCTGLLAKYLLEQNISVITQKMIQTGCEHYADDILKHRKMMGTDLYPQDLNFMTMPCVLNYPCSPHLASRLDNKPIDLEHIYQATCQLEQDFDIVFIEGAGGLYVPLTEDYFLIDYIKQYNYPVILVTSGRLGSINHTILTVQAILNAGLTLYTVIYNSVHDHQDKIIAEETQRYLKQYLTKISPTTKWWADLA